MPDYFKGERLALDLAEVAAVQECRHYGRILSVSITLRSGQVLTLPENHDDIYGFLQRWKQFIKDANVKP